MLGLSRVPALLGARSFHASAAALSGLNGWSKFNPTTLSAAQPAELSNFVEGEWRGAAKSLTVVDPLNGEPFITVPDTQPGEIDGFVRGLRSTPKSGLHNPLKKPERYRLYGDVSARAAAALRDPEVADHFVRLIQRVVPKSYAQAEAEVTVTRLFLENFSGDQVRFLARSFGVPGDHAGQTSVGHRWPYGGVAVIAPFNFPLEIPALQMMGALYMGNRPVVHADAKVALVLEEFVRLLHHCGMPASDLDLFHGTGVGMHAVLMKGGPRSTLFTGSQRVAEKLSADLGGRLFLEDAGFDWKILGPDVQHYDHVAWQCDQDAYACSGQKCSAQSILFVHQNWADAGLEASLAKKAAARRLDDLTIGPVLTWTTSAILEHTQRLLAIPGARLAWGGKPLTGHSIPERYGAVEPTAVYVPLEEALKPKNFEAVTTELFGPFQVITTYTDEQLPLVLQACERMEAHLTAAVVSNDQAFLQHVLANTVNGTTYAGARARTTGAPQNHWFGPSGDPRGAGIGTPEAIKLVWSTHREIIHDVGPVPDPATLVQS